MAVRTIVEPVAMTTNALEAHILDIRLLLPYSWLWHSFSRRILSGTSNSIAGARRRLYVSYVFGLSNTFGFCPISNSIYRVATNHKLAAPVCFIQLSAPSITMYAMTIMAQPSKHREQELEASSEVMSHFEEIHRDMYLPMQHFMMILSLIGMVSVLHSLWARWPTFRLREFSPAHIGTYQTVANKSPLAPAYGFIAG
jgi:hypothetical protein